MADPKKISQLPVAASVASNDYTVLVDGTTIQNKRATIAQILAAAVVGGTVTSVNATGTNGVSVSGGPITGAGTLTISLGNLTPTSVSATNTVSGSNLSGSNTGDQAVSISGDVTAPSSTGALVATLATGAVTNTILANMTGPAVKGRTAGTGAPTDVSISTLNTLLPEFVPDTGSGGAKGLVTPPGAGDAAAGKFLRADATWAVPGGGPSSGTVTSVNASGGSTGLTFSGGPVTGAGTLTLAGIVNVANGGTGQVTAGAALNALLPSQVGASGKVLQSDGTNTSFVAVGGSGTVTSVSVTTNAGVSGVVASATSTPAISITLGAITPTTVNSITLSGSSTPTLAVTGTTSVSGANTGDQTNITGNAATATQLAVGRTIAVTGDIAYTSPAFDGSADVTAAGTLATVATAGTTGSSTAVPVITINAKGLTTSITTAAVIAPAGTLTGASLASGVTASSLTSFGASPALGTPASGVATNITGLPLTTGVTGVLPATNGGTGATTLTLNNVLLGNGTSAVQFVAPGTSGNGLISNGTTWTSAVIPAGITSAGATITANTTLTAASPGYQPIAMTALGQSVTLPDATTVSVGSPKFYLNNASGAYPVGIRNTSGTLLMAIAAGGTAFVSCQDITTAAGVWNITGDNLEPGLITIDSTFSSTYASTRLLPFVAFDSNKSLHFLSLSSGFAAVAVDNTTGAVGTPVTVSATASMVPRSAFLITSTTAIVFYSSTTGTLIGVVISLSGATTLTVGTASSTLTDTGVGVDNFSGAPKIAQLAATLYLVSYATATGAGNTSVAAFQVSGGTTVNLGSAVNIIATNNVINSTTTYPLTATTALVIYMSGAASPYTISAVVVSVTNANPPVCTVATPTASGTRMQLSAPASCLLSATKALVVIDTNDDIVGSRAFTISGTTVTVGALLTLETIGAGTSAELAYIGNTATRTRYNPTLFSLSASTALFSYITGTGADSRVVILTESAGTVTAGTILYNSVSIGNTTAEGGGNLFEQGTSNFLASKLNSSITGTYPCRVVPHKISGTTITTGNAMVLPELGVLNSTNSFFGTRLSSGDYLLSPTNSNASALVVVRTNGDAINYRQSVKMPFGTNGSFAYPFPKVSSNRIVLIGRPFGSTIDSDTTYQLRLVNIEIAA